jgi:hypothetical protein
MRVLARDRTEHAERGGHGVALALQPELENVLRIEVDRIRGKRRAGGMLDALVDRQDGHISRSRQAAVKEQRLEVPENAGGPVGGRDDLIDEPRAGQVQHFLRDGPARVIQQVVCIGPKDFVYLLTHLSLLHAGRANRTASTNIPTTSRASNHTRLGTIVRKPQLRLCRRQDSGVPLFSALHFRIACSLYDLRRSTHRGVELLLNENAGMSTGRLENHGVRHTRMESGTNQAGL